MCAFSHPELGDWFSGAFEFLLIRQGAVYVANGVMADVTAEDKIKWLKMLSRVRFGGHNIWLWLRLNGLVFIVVKR